MLVPRLAFLVALGLVGIGVGCFDWRAGLIAVGALVLLDLRAPRPWWVPAPPVVEDRKP